MSITTTELMEGVKLHKIDTKKYKTNLLAIYLTSKLDRKHVTENALMLAILRRGTNKLKTQEDINIKLEELYGADFNCGIDKLCNDSVFKFYMESLNDEFLYEKENIISSFICDYFYCYLHHSLVCPARCKDGIRDYNP